MIEDTTIVIADDDPRVRERTRRVLGAAGFEVVGEAADAAGAVAAAIHHRPHVCLYDIRMPGSGIRATAETVVAVPETSVVMYTISLDDDDLFEALRAGAKGYLLKDTDDTRLPLALKGVLAGEAALPRNLVSRLIEEFRVRDRPRRLSLAGRDKVQLTAREWDVLELMRQGLSTSEMAERLFVSNVTVRTHIASILRKLQVTTRSEAVDLFGGNRLPGSPDR